jgi:hypothetical protein
VGTTFAGLRLTALTLALGWCTACGTRSDGGNAPAPPIVLPQQQPQQVDVSGAWTTVFLAPNAGMGLPYAVTLTQSGSQVTGTYTAIGQGGSPGILQGSLTGNQFTATWRDAAGPSGIAAFTFSPDARSFTGTWTGPNGATGTWSGNRSQE